MFEVLWAQTSGMRVEKTRYKIPYGKYIIELDIYEGHLKRNTLLKVASMT